MVRNRFKIIHFLRIVRILFILSGAFFLLSILIALTTLPFWGYHWLGTSKAELKREPTTIVLLGGGGMPSESNLIRSWYTEQAADAFANAHVLIAMPGDVNDSLSTPRQMKTELVKRSINPERMMFENNGANTRSQALNSKNILNIEDPILLVTSPEHMRRAVLSFRKVGFKNVYALPAFENAVEADLSFNDDELGGNKTLVPDVGKSIQLRYQLWNHLKYEILIAREFMALGYYKLRGWI
jgi:uncharacterized SAM-binding protein YcdF (DUF218 family)